MVRNSSWESMREGGSKCLPLLVDKWRYLPYKVAHSHYPFLYHDPIVSQQFPSHMQTFDHGVVIVPKIFAELCSSKSLMSQPKCHPAVELSLMTQLKLYLPSLPVLLYPITLLYHLHSTYLSMKWSSFCLLLWICFLGFFGLNFLTKVRTRKAGTVSFWISATSQCLGKYLVH